MSKKVGFKIGSSIFNVDSMLAQRVSFCCLQTQVASLSLAMGPTALVGGGGVHEQSCLAALNREASAMSGVLQHRAKTLECVRRAWRSRGLAAAVALARSVNDPSVIVDLLGVLNERRYRH